LTTWITSSTLSPTTSCDHYQPFHAFRADLLARAGQLDDAVAAYDRAIELSTNRIEQEWLSRQRAHARPPGSS
jgi:RNA polymerase sigma-70 factor (ECF subfamily)